MSITTFDYVPKIILGKTGNYTFNAINLFTRAIAFYIYFKTTDELDILELILAYVFPIIYILYKTSQENTDYILGLFSFGKSSKERCIERRGADLLATKHGDRKSIPEDAKACGDVVLGTINTISDCLAISSVGDSRDPEMYPEGVNACLYIPEEVDENVKSYKSYECGVYNTRNRCHSQKDDDNSRLCQWKNIEPAGDCEKDLYQIGISSNERLFLSKRECPISCEYLQGRSTESLTLASQVSSAAASTATITVDETPTTLEPGDTLEFSDSDGSSTCGIVPTSFTVSSVNGSTITVNEEVQTSSSGTPAECAITHVPLTGCSDRGSESASSGGTRRGYCSNK